MLQWLRKHTWHTVTHRINMARIGPWWRFWLRRHRDWLHKSYCLGTARQCYCGNLLRQFALKWRVYCHSVQVKMASMLTQLGSAANNVTTVNAATLYVTADGGARLRGRTFQSLPASPHVLSLSRGSRQGWDEDFKHDASSLRQSYDEFRSIVNL